VILLDQATGTEERMTTKASVVTLDEDQLAQVREALDLADGLVSMVISGRTGQQRVALDFARALSAIKRNKVLSTER